MRYIILWLNLLNGIMKKTNNMKKIIGYILMALLIIGLTWLMVSTIGWVGMLFTYGCTAVIVGLVVLIVHLIWG